MKKKYDFLDNTNQEKELRLQIREVADSVRIQWAKKGIYDIFEILENQCILIRKPINGLSGFTTYIDGSIVAFINSSHTLGRERFTAAHELGHIILHDDVLKSKLLLTSNGDDALEKEADIFAVEFLMPELGVKEVFYKIIGVDPKYVTEKHVIRMHNYFKVCYKAMLKRLVYLDLCSQNKYEELCSFCSLENAEILQKITQQEGYDCSLIKPSYVIYVSKEYEEIIKRNYEKRKISFKKFESLVEFIGKKPEDYGYEVSEDEY